MKTKLLLLPIARLLLAIVACLPVWGSNLFAQTRESYVVLDNAAGTLTFKHDANKPAGAFSLNEDKTFPAWLMVMVLPSIIKTTLRKLSSIPLSPMLVQRIVMHGSLHAKI